MPARNPKPESFLRSNLTYAGRDCLIWPFRRTKRGYGVLKHRGIETTASRRMCELVYGPAPAPEYDAAHFCGNGHLGCVAPNHLRWATKSENAADKLVHGTAIYGEAHAFSHISEEQAKAIYVDPRTHEVIAEQYGCAPSTVGAIKAGRNWRHVTGHRPLPPGTPGQRGDKHHNAKLTPEMVLEIYASGEPQIRLAERFGCSRATICYIKSGKKWGHVTGHCD